MPTTAWFLFLLLTPASDWEQHFSQAEKLERQGLHAGAQAEFETSLASAEQLGPQDPKLPLTLHNLGTVARELGHYPEAERYFQRAVFLWDTNQPQRQLELAGTLQNLGALNMVWGRYARSEAFYRRAYALRVTALGPNRPHVGASLHGLAELAAARHRYAEADDLYRQAEPILKAAYGPTSLRMADLWHNWGFLNSELHREAAARVLLGQAAAIYQTALPGHPNAAIILRNLAELDFRAGNVALAGTRLERALQICRNILPADHEQTGIILQTYARYLEQAKRKRDARVAAEKSRAILAKQQMETGEAYTVDVVALRARP